MAGRAGFAHDERLDAAINQSVLTGTPPEQVLINRVRLEPIKKGSGSPFDVPADREAGPASPDDGKTPDGPTTSPRRSRIHRGCGCVEGRSLRNSSPRSATACTGTTGRASPDRLRFMR